MIFVFQERKYIIRILILIIFLELTPINFNFAQTSKTDDKPVLAILKLRALEPLTDSEAIQITSFLQSELLYTQKFTLTDRAQVDEILKEMSFQQSGVCDVKCAAEIGKMLVASKVIKGSVGKLGNAYTISVDLVDVETARIENSANLLEKCQLEDLPAFIHDLVENLLSQVSADLQKQRPLSVQRPSLNTDKLSRVTFTIRKISDLHYTQSMVVCASDRDRIGIISGKIGGTRKFTLYISTGLLEKGILDCTSSSTLESRKMEVNEYISPSGIHKLEALPSGLINTSLLLNSERIVVDKSASFYEPCALWLDDYNLIFSGHGGMFAGPGGIWLIKIQK